MSEFIYLKCFEGSACRESYTVNGGDDSVPFISDVWPQREALGWPCGGLYAGFARETC